MNEKFPTLALVVKYGKPAGIAVTALIGVIVACVGWPLIGWPSVLLALFVGAIVLVLVLCFVELVQLITEMLMPQ